MKSGLRLSAGLSVQGMGSKSWLSGKGGSSSSAEPLAYFDSWGLDELEDDGMCRAWPAELLWCELSQHEGLMSQGWSAGNHVSGWIGGSGSHSGDLGYEAAEHQWPDHELTPTGERRMGPLEEILALFDIDPAPDVPSA